MSARQDKATTERHARMLREMVKRPENKYCADCKRNDPRWASWNIGCFMCIRCSGIHRSMGTHISKVKSVDLDTWTPEQMATIQKWGNRRANLFWEAHLKAGHVPPDHKMESFIRSKYESRRWAREGPPPSDPSVLDEEGDGGEATVPVPADPAPPSAPRSPPPQASSRQAAPVRTTISSSASGQPRQLLSAQRAAAAATPPPQPQPAAPAAAPAPASNELFSLDFHAPAPGSAGAPAQNAGGGQAKNVKNDILSLFSSAPAQPASANAFGQFNAPQSAVQTQGGGGDPWGAFNNAPASAPPQTQTQTTSMMGTSGPGMWGASSGWNAPQPAPQQQQQAPTNNLWGAPTITNTTAGFGMGGSGAGADPWGASAPAAQGTGMANTNDIWGGGGGAGGGGGGDLFGGSAASAQTQKKDDAFGDLWGGFK